MSATDDLIKELCGEGWRDVVLSHAARPSARDDARRVLVHHGWGGFPFADDGYEFMDRVLSGAAGGSAATVALALAAPASTAIRPWAAVGDWPYHVVLLAVEDNALIHYMEGDVTIEVYDDRAALQAGMRDELEAHPCP